MKLVLDTNIVFSALLNPYSTGGSILLEWNNHFQFFAPELLVRELDRYDEKVLFYSKLNKEDLSDIKKYVLKSITFVSENFVSVKASKKAEKLTQDIDISDKPFIALALDLDTKLWTGDKKLTNSINQMNPNIIITTEQVKKLAIE